MCGCSLPIPACSPIRFYQRFGLAAVDVFAAGSCRNVGQVQKVPAKAQQYASEFVPQMFKCAAGVYDITESLRAAISGPGCDTLQPARYQALE